MFFLGGEGEGKRNSRTRLPRRFRRTTRVPNSPMLYIIYFAVEVSLSHMSSGHREDGPRSSIVMGRHMRCSVSTTRRPSPRIEDGEGVVAPRSATDSTEQWVCCLCTCGLCWYVLYVYYMYMSATRQLGRGFQIGMFRPIRVDHTNCLQVAIKTHSVILTVSFRAPSGSRHCELPGSAEPNMSHCSIHNQSSRRGARRRLSCPWGFCKTT
jgi:hypothetical protein